MTNLFAVSMAYKIAVMHLALGEINYVSQQLKLPTPHPIQMMDVTKSFVASPKLKFVVAIDTTNFLFSFKDGGKLYDVWYKTKNLESFDLYPAWSKMPSLINSNGAYQLATQWLISIDVDTRTLEKKYGSKLKIEQPFFWDPPGTTNKTILPIFNVTWGDGSDYPAQVRILGTTKELMELRLADSSLSCRPSLIITNALELNNIPDPPVKHLQHFLQTNSSATATNAPSTRPPPFHKTISK